jgi:predicted O-methyltransferase YrrM
MAAQPLQHQDELTAFLTWAQTVTPLNVIVEIGSHRGGTMELWARIAKTLVVAIDLPDGVGGGLSIADMAARNINFARRFPHVVGIMGDSHDWLTKESLADALDWHTPFRRWVDLLFIDGDHTLEGVTADYETYREFVRPGGIIAFHDVTCSEERAARENLGVTTFFATLPYEKHVFSVGWEWGGIGAIVV